MTVLTTSNFQGATNPLTGGRDGAVVSAHPSHKCSPGSIPAWCHMWVEFVVGSHLATRVFLRVPPSAKTNTSKYQFDQDRGHI